MFPTNDWVLSTKCMRAYLELVYEHRDGIEVVGRGHFGHDDGVLLRMVQKNVVWFLGCWYGDQLAHAVCMYVCRRFGSGLGLGRFRGTLRVAWRLGTRKLAREDGRGVGYPVR